MNDDIKLDNDIVELAVEKALTKMGLPEFQIVKENLQKDYGCKLSEVLIKPECLKKVLADLFGNASDDIIKSINDEFKAFTIDKHLSNFLTVLNENK